MQQEHALSEFKLRSKYAGLDWAMVNEIRLMLDLSSRLLVLQVGYEGVWWRMPLPCRATHLLLTFAAAAPAALSALSASICRAPHLLGLLCAGSAHC